MKRIIELGADVKVLYEKFGRVDEFLEDGDLGAVLMEAGLRAEVLCAGGGD